MKNLLDNQKLEKSSIIANSLMNRERGIIGKNSYSKEIGINILDYLTARINDEQQLNWLDLCCGSGKALIEAAEYFNNNSLQNRINILGIDLVPMFQTSKSKFNNLKLVVDQIDALELNQKFDLITCIHGLHYIGDKLKVIEKSISWLTKEGIFYANLDLNNIKSLEDEKLGLKVIKLIRKQGDEYKNNRKLLICSGQNNHIPLPFSYLGADDSAGPNYTGQPAVNSYYQ